MSWGYWKRACAALFLLATLILAGCAQPLPSDEPVTITFACPASEQERYQALVLKFNEEYPHITVELDDTDAEEADVFITSSFELGDLLEENTVLSMAPFIEQDSSFDPSDFYPGTVELLTRDGKMWAVPAGVDLIVLYYSKDLFDAPGVPYPEPGWTWDNFLNAALALRDPGAEVFGYGPMNEFIESMIFIYQHGGRILDDMQSPTRWTFDDPLTIEALEWYAALVHEHNVAPTQEQLYTLGSSIESGVYLGQVAMWTGWLSERGGGIGDVEDRWPGAWKMRWGLISLPRDAQAGTLAWVLGYAISAEAAHPEACWQWIAFLSQQSQASFGMVPPRKSIAESAAYEQLVGADAATVARQSMESAMLISPALVEFGNLGVYGRAINAIMEGSATPQEAMTRAQQQVTQGENQ